MSSYTKIKLSIVARAYIHIFGMTSPSSIFCKIGFRYPEHELDISWSQYAWTSDPYNVLIPYSFP